MRFAERGAIRRNARNQFYDVASAEKKGHVARAHGVARMFPRLFASAGETHGHDSRFPDGLVQVRDISALDRPFERRVSRAEHKVVSPGERPREIRQKRLCARMAMRLEKDNKPAAASIASHSHRTCHLGRMVSIVSHYGHRFRQA